MKRAFTLLEITISVAVVGLVAAAAMSALSSISRAKERDAAGDRIVAMVNRARDVARTQGTCTAVVTLCRDCYGGVSNFATYTYRCGDTFNPVIPPNTAGGSQVEIERFSMPSSITSVCLKKPGPSCLPVTGTAKPSQSCYLNMGAESAFTYRTDGTTDLPYSVVINGAQTFVVQPGSGTIRRDD